MKHGTQFNPRSYNNLQIKRDLLCRVFSILHILFLILNLSVCGRPLEPEKVENKIKVQFTC